ncbi:MAG TPA: protein-glutamate O-methyltransferase CheR [Caulobacteraceae bacterium]|nr:protein-glutamate O-methyltransferase CheR [Caulobacteraceae bacterium]
MSGLSREALAHLAAVLAARAGQALNVADAYGVENRLTPAARRQGFGSAEAFVSAMRDSGEEAFETTAAEALTSGETWFFRDAATWTLLREQVLPALASSRGDEPVRVWSAGCSTGQEPYSLTMLLDEARDLLPSLKIEILATDLSEPRLHKARAGLYTPFEIQRGLPARMMVRHFEKAEDAWTAKPHLRQAVRWRRVELTGANPPAGRFDLVLCRNLLGGMTPAARDAATEILVRALADDGRLVLGAGESVAHEALQPAAGRAGLYLRRAEGSRRAA